MSVRVPFKELSESGIGRARGLMAFRILKSHLTAQSVEIDFTGEDLVSLSFMDELVLRLIESKQLEKVVFVASDALVLEKLAQVSAIRSATIYVRGKSGEPKTILKPKPTTPISLKVSRASGIGK
ncbi:MAG: hypothetical protein FJ143_03085 [Deltaproteobacteria bacterium]|nr:hypothetical protein [Deltaproteobacteria bacterium]